MVPIDVAKFLKLTYQFAYQEADMASTRLTKSVVDGLEPAAPRAARKSRHGDADDGKLIAPNLYLWDAGKGAVLGFGVKVTPTGGKSFVFQYRVRGSRTDRRYKIGRYGDWTVELARERARELRRMADDGIDPIEHYKANAREAERAKIAATDGAFNKVSEKWFEAYKVEPRKSGARGGRTRSAATIRMVKSSVALFDKHFCSRPITEIDEMDLRRAFDTIPPKQLATRRNVYASMRLLWSWAHRHRIIPENAFERLEAPVLPPSRDRVLSDAELSLIWRATRRIAYPFGPAYRLLVLTGQRREEVFGMRWSELDETAMEWKIPGDRTKNGLPHIVPISPAAAEELTGIVKGKRWPSKGLVFTINGKTSSSGFSGAKRRLDAVVKELAAKEEVDAPPPWRLHDFRRTVATGLQQLGVRLEVTEAVLNHASGSRGGIVGIYQQYEWGPEKREALNAWAARVLDLIKPKRAFPDNDREENSSSGNAQ